MEEKLGFPPVGLVVLDRYKHFCACFESLESCVGACSTSVYVALDFPPTERYVKGWKKVDDFLKEKEKNHKFKKLVVFRRTHTYGIKGERSNAAELHRFMMENYEEYVMSEDDNVFSSNFLLYMRKCLERYRDNDEVIAITGYSFPIEWCTSHGATVQKQDFNASAWGWGWWTCKRREVMHRISSGDMYNKAPEIIKFKKYKRGLFVAFYEYVCASIIPIEYFRKIQSGRLGLMDYCVRQYLFVYDKKVISPLVSKVRNIGVDGSGVYCQNNNASDGSGTNSWNTDFSHQDIDKSENFEIIENSGDLLDENRRRFDKYEWRPFRQHAITVIISIGIQLLGIRIMRALSSIVLKLWHRRIN